ncbi:glycosyltransferase family 2 protein [Pontivivens ytuae]|uniref:Glycosyltransferase family 2 protein n=1 Tax=Pontivivens ytuae TaxID=2789856 RepID=A0A7S9LPM8_9RHOB|nr:glycosyltransferase family 2 protein [Pontivivens ytuae]QPH52660.1 glycosyltransferase family 2 protein [Pontivivens ytuae]
MRVLAILCVKDEGVGLLHWLAHHRALGVTDVLAFSNDCSDGTDAMLDRLAAMGVVEHLRGRDGARGPQWRALREAAEHPLMAVADWVICIDVDEYVNLRGRDLAWLAGQAEADCWALTWRMFGSSGLTEWEDRPVTDRFIRCAPNPLHWPWRCAMIKTLWRRGTYARPGVHRPLEPAGAPVWVDSNGARLPERFVEKGVFTDFTRSAYGLVQLNHYALGDAESFVVKAARGRPNRQGNPADAGYWVERNFNQVEDASILAHGTPELEDWIADPELAALRERAVTWRSTRFAELMREDAWRDLYTRVVMAGESRAFSPAEAQAIMAHARG